ncbi:lysylphosphatidylglycerol synthase domain-containing protein [Streptomyces microflavus]|uniref:Lysylphosphatidylglycerol synthase domain-containing protein n=1 Tax=Streptomyces microflavus TaxID=1919 RepID=A0A6N9VA57_STRMI|nr:MULTISPECIES: lysylphosphatidylglycerol synthase transmembrane domain-containing protein [Streptomyces]NEB69754.1 TIGR00374 family protein [Streptomyces microflavus]QTA34614.1 flippase-like domain-containing protein [Streptomyces sp. CA-256286]WSR93789.1 lysylphosphatidylglycerol synthase domain-containing protein [Streptomyces microflavus]
MQPPKAADASDAGERPSSAPEPAGERSSSAPESAEERPSNPPERAGERPSSRPERAESAPEPAGAVRADGPTATTSGHLTGSTLASAEAALSDRVSGDEPLLPARVHRPSDLMRLLIGIAAIAVLFAIAAFAQGTTTGLEDDISKGTEQAPDLLIKIAGLVSSIAVLLVPVAFAIERLIKRDGLRIADGVLAAVLAHGVTLATDLWVSRSAPGTIQEALTQPQPGAGLTDPVHGYLAPVIAYMTAVGMARRPRWRVVLWAVLLLDAFAMLVGGYTTPFSIILTVLIGWTVAYGTLYAVGSPNVRPTGQHLMAGLRHVGFRPVAAMRTEDAPDNDNTDQNDRGRRYLVTLEDGPPLDVTVVDREQQAQGFFYRAWRRLTLRGITQRRSIQSLRQALEQEALLAYAAIAAGANAPKLIATSELGPDAVMLVYEHIGGRSLDQMEDEEITDDLVRSAWRQVKALQSRRIAHRRLTGDALLVDRSGKAFVTDLRGGEIAAGDLVLRMDVAQLLTTLGLRVGAERSVSGALAVLGPDAVADCLPLLQPIALSRSTRATLRRLARERSQQEREAVLEASRAAKEARAHDAAEAAAERTPEHEAERTSLEKPDHTSDRTSEPKAGQRAGHKAERKSLRTEKQAEKQAEKRAVDDAMEEAREGDLLAQIRRQVLLIRPQAPVEPVRLERIKPRTLFSFIAGAIAAYFLISQVTQADFGVLVEQAEWGWVAAALGFSALSYVAAAMSLLGFVPERVPFRKTVLAQVAGSFVKIVAPAAIGGVALNTRFLQRAGVRPGLAVASVGASQLFGLGCHILLLGLFGYLTGTEKTPDSLTPSRTVIAGLLTVAVLVLVVTAIPFLRKFVVTRVRSLFAGVVPRMLDVVQRPQKLVTGIGGMLLLTGLFVLCLDASIRAFSGPDVTQLSYASIAVVFLAGNAIGSAAPTPGGMGAVEGALTLGLIAVGLPMEVAAPAVLLYRVMTLWLPVLPGWICFNQLTRKGEL